MKIKDRPRDPAKWDEIADVVSALLNPVIANGDIFEYKDFKRIKDATGLHFNNTAHLLPYQLALSNILFFY
jgi:tRNA-dihydrouridine synthase